MRANILTRTHTDIFIYLHAYIHLHFHTHTYTQHDIYSLFIHHTNFHALITLNVVNDRFRWCARCCARRCDVSRQHGAGGCVSPIKRLDPVTRLHCHQSVSCFLLAFHIWRYDEFSLWHRSLQTACLVLITGFIYGDMLIEYYFPMVLLMRSSLWSSCVALI